ncbi:hypothetical protein RchiOBHm_Chr6g0265061 [Rosa chinensis]|uniref:Uncharacterized protein n=1 Tax=Rosa chinensis TaxID=74649 RepID=A0A2P6PPA9_ROSCH|nr:hypothetical protein RchiOBHm_Chr6g0265061 [Rosa chinensis]
MTDVSSSLSFKRRRLPSNLDRIEAHIFEASAFSSNYQEAEDDEIFEFTAEDYYRVLNSRKMRGAEEQVACRSRITKVVNRVRCPDDETLLESSFHPSEKIQSLLDLLNKVVARPFQIYTTPPN